MDPAERAWLEAVADRLGTAREGEVLEEEAVRLLLRVTKVAAEATGVRYLAPLTAYLIGEAAGRARAAGGPFHLRRAVEEVSRLAEGWARSREG
jgi:hypothetical protein